MEKPRMVIIAVLKEIHESPKSCLPIYHHLSTSSPNMSQNRTLMPKPSGSKRSGVFAQLIAEGALFNSEQVEGSSDHSSDTKKPRLETSPKPSSEIPSAAPWEDSHLKPSVAAAMKKAEAGENDMSVNPDPYEDSIDHAFLEALGHLTISWDVYPGVGP